MIDVDLKFTTNDGSKDMSLVIFLINKNQMAQCGSNELKNVSIPKMTIPMKNLRFGEFETTVNLK